MKVISTLVAASLLIESVAGIYGGTAVPGGTKPYMTGIRSNGNVMSFNSFNFCGAAYLGNKYVLTTVTCVEVVNQPAVFADVNATYLSGESGGQQIPIVKIMKHPKYDKESGAYNFALLTLKYPSSTRGIKLPTSNNVYTPGTQGIVMGWGLVNKSTASDELLQLNQSVQNEKVCANEFGKLDESVLCARDKTGSPCTGDMGSPLVYLGKPGNGDDILMGLVMGSAGGSCGNYLLTLYADVRAAIPWIKATTDLFK